MHNRWICKENIRSCTGVVSKSSGDETGSVERAIKKSKGEVSEVRALPGREMTTVHIDSGAVDAAGPKEIAKALEMRQTDVEEGHMVCCSKRGQL